MSKFYYEEYPATDYEIKIYGIPYSKQPKTPRTLGEWANDADADIVYPLAMYNMVKGEDQYGEIYGRTLQYVRGQAGDVGYGGTSFVLGIQQGIPKELFGANSAGNCQYACAGYKAAIVSGDMTGGLDKTNRRSRNVNGISKDGHYFHMLTSDGVTEYECAEFLKGLGVQFALMQDGGGTTAKWMDGKTVFAPEGGRATCSAVCIKRKKTIENGGFTYVNGASRKPVYETSMFKKQIGSLDPNERCTLLYEDESFKVVIYYITGTTERKVGFIKG